MPPEVCANVKRLSGFFGLWAICGMAAAGCSLSTQHGYVQSEDGSLSFRYPPEWNDLAVDPVTTEWVAGVDASDQPSLDNLNELTATDPVVLAAVYRLEPRSRDTITLSSLRRLALPTGEDPTEDPDDKVRVLFHNTIVDGNGFEGHHIRFEIDLPEGGTATTEQLAVLDAGRDRVHQVRVNCVTSCFADNAPDIDELFESIRLRP